MQSDPYGYSRVISTKVGTFLVILIHSQSHSSQPISPSLFRFVLTVLQHEKMAHANKMQPFCNLLFNNKLSCRTTTTTSINR